MGRFGISLRGILGIAGVCALALTASGCATEKTASGPVPDKAEVMTKARASYYSLRREGLSEFKCTMVPNWDGMLAKLRQNNPDEAARRLKLFQQIHFEFTATSRGVIKITHGYSGGEVPKDLEDNFGHIYHGMEQMMTGFFDTWKGFVLIPFLPPPNAEYTLERKGGDYFLSYKEGDTAVDTVLDPDYVIKSTHIANKEFDATLQPQFTKVDGKLLLSGYEGTYTGANGSDKAVLHVHIENQLVDGFRLPGKLTGSGSNGASEFSIESTFTDCHATKR